MALTRPTLVRLLRIHQAIASETCPTLEQLADECEVHPRTVKRDIRLLREQLKAPLRYSQERRGYRYERQFSLVPAPFHERELLALSIAIDVANSLRNTPFAAAIRGALEKMRMMMPETGQFSEGDRAAAIAYVPDPAPPEQVQTAIHFNQLLDAINAHRQVRLTYYSLSTQSKTVRTVDPYQLYLHHGVWYLHGLCHLRSETRDFAVHRILGVQVLAQTFRPPDVETLREKLAQRFTIIQDSLADVRIWFDADTAPFIKERIWHGTQQITDHPDGSCTLDMRVQGLPSVFRWVLSFGRHAIALAPAKLVAQVRAEAQAMATPRSLPKGCRAPH